MKGKRYSCFDVVKCLAMLMVLNQHFWSTQYQGMEKLIFPFTVLCSGHTGVACFFILSGFGMTYSCMTSDKEWTFRFFVKKIYKRYIKFTLPILITCIFTIIITNKYIIGSITGSIDIVTGFESLTIIDAITDGIYGVLFLNRTRFSYAFWTMTYEWFASVYIYLSAPIFRKENKFIRLSFYFITLLIGVIIDPTYAVFVVGMLIAELAVHRQDYVFIDGLIDFITKRISLKNLLMFLLLVMFFVFGSYPSYEMDSVWNFFGEWRRLIMQVMHICSACSVIVLMLLWNPQNTQINNIFAYIEKYSYYIYIIHVLILSTIFNVIMHINGENNIIKSIGLYILYLSVCFGGAGVLKKVNDHIVSFERYKGAYVRD